MITIEATIDVKMSQSSKTAPQCPGLLKKKLKSFKVAYFNFSEV